MSYSDKDAQREYQRKWIAKRRLTWLDSHGPCVRCGSVEDLEVDHIDASTKVSHSVWSWRQSKRDEELAKCQVLCHSCHLIKTAECGDRGESAAHGKQRRYEVHSCRCDVCVKAMRSLWALKKVRRKQVA